MAKPKKSTKTVPKPAKVAKAKPRAKKSKEAKAPYVVPVPKPGKSTSLDFDAIKDDWKFAIRTPDDANVDAILASIKEQGLLENLVVDEDDVLLAGNHRYAAIKKLRKTEPETFDKLFPNAKIPVNRCPFSAKEKQAEAIAVALAENQKRQNIDPVAIKNYRDFLVKEMGLSKGRPKKDQLAISTLLRNAFKRSPRSIRRDIAKAKGIKPAVRGRMSKEELAKYLPSAVTPEEFAKLNGLERAQRLIFALDLSAAEKAVLQEWCGKTLRDQGKDITSKSAVSA